MGSKYCQQNTEDDIQNNIYEGGKSKSSGGISRNA